MGDSEDGARRAAWGLGRGKLDTAWRHSARLNSALKGGETRRMTGQAMGNITWGN